jgi:C1A family cysteine protease
MSRSSAKALRHGHRPIGGGWVAEQPDARDVHARHPLVRKAVAGLAAPRPALPASADLRRWCGRVRFQGGLPTCNAHVVASLIEYFERRAFGKVIEPSRLFLFRVAKNFARADDATPVYIRQTMGVLKMIGVPPEKFWPYPKLKKDAAGQYPMDDPKLHEEPTPFCYALAADYQAITYYRLDPRDADGQLTITPRALLDEVRLHVASGIPMTMGVPLYRDTVTQSWTNSPGVIPYPGPKDVSLGGHALVAVGYDDAKTVPRVGKRAGTKGALLVQNSWGRQWGEKGFGWLPYEYLLRDRARDFWTLTKAEWTDTGAFQLGLTQR